MSESGKVYHEALIDSEVSCFLQRMQDTDNVLLNLNIWRKAKLNITNCCLPFLSGDKIGGKKSNNEQTKQHIWLFLDSSCIISSYHHVPSCIWVEWQHIREISLLGFSNFGFCSVNSENIVIMPLFQGEKREKRER